jgi:hypothetical protein
LKAGVRAREKKFEGEATIIFALTVRIAALGNAALDDRLQRGNRVKVIRRE